MTPTGRRTFAKSLGLLGLFAIGVEGYKQASEKLVFKGDELATDDVVKQLNYSGHYLSFKATYGEIDTSPVDPISVTFRNGTRYIPGTEKNVSVDLKPGPDGKLYVKERDIWRKV